MKLNDKVYNVLKWVCIIFLPALGTLIFALGAVWGFDASQIVGTITALNTFLGALIGVSTISYNKDKGGV